MPPFVYRSLKDFMRVSATAKTRQELLQRLIASAAKRKSQLHIDATGARLATSPETFGMNIGKQMMNKQANPLTNLLARLRPSSGRLFDAVFSIPGVPARLPSVARPVLSAAEEAAERKAGVPPQILKNFLNTSRPMPAMRVPSAAEIQQKILEKAERAAGIPPQKIMNKQANPLTQMLSPALKNLRGKVVPELLQRLQILAGKGARGVKRYGQRLVGDDTLKPLYARQEELRALEQQLRHQAGSRIDTKPINQKITLMHDLVDDLYGYRKHLRDLDPKKMFDSRMAQGGAEEAAHRQLFPMSNRVLETRAPFSAQQNMRFGLNRARARGSAAMASENLRRLKELFGGRLSGMANLHAGQPGFTPGLLDTADSSFRAQLKALAEARAHNARHTDIWYDQLPNVFRSQNRANKAIQKELDAIESARAYTAGGAAGATLGGVGYNAYANSGEPAMKQSMTMPQPTSRGTMKKVQMPEASPGKPDCDPEGVQMSAQDHESAKEAGLERLGTNLLVHLPAHVKQSAANEVDAHPTSFIPLIGGAISGSVKQHPGLGPVNSTLREGIAGLRGGFQGGGLSLGAMILANLLTRGRLGFKSNIAAGLTGSSLGTHYGAQTSRENVPLNARALAALGHKTANQKQAFMGIGGLAGMATAPEGEEDLSVGRGALRGVGTALGAGAGAGLGAIGGAGIGTIGGGLLGALAGALSKRRGESYGQAIGGSAAGGAAMGGGLGYLAGIPAGAIYGGIRGNKATKALLDKTAPISEKKKKKNDDKETKKAACIVLDLMHKNNPVLKQSSSEDFAMYRQYQAEGTSMPYHEWYAQQQNENAPTPAAPAPAPSAPPQPAPAAPQPPQGGFFSRMGAKADASVNAAGNAITAPGRMLGDAVGSRAAGAYYAGQNAFRTARRNVQNFGRTVNSYIPSFRSPIHFPNAQQNNMQQ